MRHILVMLHSKTILMLFEYVKFTYIYVCDLINVDSICQMQVAIIQFGN